MKCYFLFILMGCLSLQFVSAQGTPTSFHFDKDSLSKDFIINIDSDYSELIIEVESRLMEGQFKVEVLSPDGKVKEVLSIDATEASEIKKIQMKGNYLGRENRHYLDKIFKNTSKVQDYRVLGIVCKPAYNPQPGHWIVRMTPKDAQAEIKVKYSIK